MASKGMSPEVKTALWIGAGLSLALGGFLIARSVNPQVSTPPEPPAPAFGQEKPEILQAIGPYGVQLVQV